MCCEPPPCTTSQGSDRGTTNFFCESLASSAHSVPTTPPFSYAKALKKDRFESIEKTIRKRRPFFAEAVKEVRLPRRVMLGKMTGGEGRRPDGQPKSWHRYLFHRVKAFDATEGPRNTPSFFLGWKPRCRQLQIRRWASGIAGSSKKLNVS